MTGCASSGPPGLCTPWGSACSERPAAPTLQRAGRTCAVSGESGRAGGGTVPRGCCNCCCTAGSGRRAG